MSGLVQGLLALAALVTVSAFTSGVLTGDVRSVAAVLAAAWLVVGLTCLLVAARRRRADRLDAS